MPQFDSTFFASQIFWLLVCLFVLFFAFKKIFIPRMDKVLFKRDSFLEKRKMDAEAIDAEIDKIEKTIERMKQNTLSRSSNIVKEAVHSAETEFKNNVSAIRKKHDENLTGARNKLKGELMNIEELLSTQIDDMSNMVIDKLLKK